MTAQLPAPGLHIARDTEIILYFDALPSEEWEHMPELSGMSYAQARDLLSSLGIFIQTWSPMDDKQLQCVGSQSIPAGAAVGHGSVVRVALVSTDDEMLGRY